MIQVCIHHTSAPQYCHLEDYYTRYWPVVGTAVTRHLLAVFLKSVHSCSRHGVVAARLTSERPGSVIPLSKNIYFTASTFVASVTVDVSETDGKRLAVRAQCFASYQPAYSLPPQSARQWNPMAILRHYTKNCFQSLSLDSSTRDTRRCWISRLQHVSLGCWPLIQLPTQYACYNIDPSNIGTTVSDSCCMLREARSEGMVKGRGIPSSRVHNLIIRTGKTSIVSLKSTANTSRLSDNDYLTLVW